MGRTWHRGLLFQSEDYGQVGGLATAFRITQLRLRHTFDSAPGRLSETRALPVKKTRL